jgi:hypothetical protein
MKKITYLIVLFFCSLSYGQVQYKLLEDYGSVIKVNDSQPIFPQDPCSIGTPSNNFETGLSNLFEPNIFANDFIVNANEVFTPDRIAFNVFVTPGEFLDVVDVFFYGEGNYGPGDELASELAIVPSSQSIIGTKGPRNVLEVVVDLTNPVALSGGLTENLYWVGIQFPLNWEGSYFEMTTILNTPNEMFLGDGIGWGAQSQTGLPEADGVISLSGDCSLLGINDNIADLVSIYPNPTSSILNLKIPTNIEVKNVKIFDILGKDVGVSYNNRFDISYLSHGVYLLKVETTAGTVTQKIVKQ